MSTSNKRPLIFIILFLLLTNIGVLGYFLWDRKPSQQGGSGKGPGISFALQNEVGFDDQQIADYRKLKEQQWAAIKPMFADLHKAKDSFFRMVSNENPSDSMVNAGAGLIAEKQKAIELQAFSHFKQVRALCRPDQLEKYDSLVQRMIRKTGKGRGGDQDKKPKK
jgi:hypothetical protein